MKKLLVLLVLVGVIMGFNASGVMAFDTAISLTTTGTAVSEISSFWSVSAPNSAHLQADLIAGPTNEGRVRIEFKDGTTLADIDSISWMQNVIGGYISHADVLYDIDHDTLVDDALVFEYAKVDPLDCDDVADYPLGVVDTFGDKGIIDDTAYAWLNSGDPGPCGGGGFIHQSFADWKGTHGTADVIAIEIEVDGWIGASEAYIDDVKINGELVQDFENDQEVTGDVMGFISFIVSPSYLDFESIPYGAAITDLGPAVTIDTTGSDTGGDNIQVSVEATSGEVAFFEALLEFADDGATNWVDLSPALALIVSPGNSMVFPTQLNGNTAQFGAGQKDAVLTYTATEVI